MAFSAGQAPREPVITIPYPADYQVDEKALIRMASQVSNSAGLMYFLSEIESADAKLREEIARARAIYFGCSSPCGEQQRDYQRILGFTRQYESLIKALGDVQYLGLGSELSQSMSGMAALQGVIVKGNYRANGSEVPSNEIIPQIQIAYAKLNIQLKLIDFYSQQGNQSAAKKIAQEFISDLMEASRFVVDNVYFAASNQFPEDIQNLISRYVNKHNQKLFESIAEASLIEIQNRRISSKVRFALNRLKSYSLHIGVNGFLFIEGLLNGWSSPLFSTNSSSVGTVAMVALFLTAVVELGTDPMSRWSAARIESGLNSDEIIQGWAPGIYRACMGALSGGQQ